MKCQKQNKQNVLSWAYRRLTFTTEKIWQKSSVFSHILSVAFFWGGFGWSSLFEQTVSHPKKRKKEGRKERKKITLRVMGLRYSAVLVCPGVAGVLTRGSRKRRLARGGEAVAVQTRTREGRRRGLFRARPRSLFRVRFHAGPFLRTRSDSAAPSWRSRGDAGAPRARAPPPAFANWLII